MADLEDTFGKDFADSIEQKIQERRSEKEKISDETKKHIANLALNEGKMHNGDPMFEYTTDEGVTHDVLLMKLAEPREGSVWNQVNHFDNGGFSIPLDYLGEWVYSIFNDESMAKKMNEGEWYLVIGNLDTWEPDDGEPQDQFSPVRGVLSMDEVKELADESMDDEGFGDGEEDDTEEDATEADTEEQTEDDTSGESKGSVFGGGDDEEEEEEDDDDEPALDIAVEDVNAVVESLAEEEEEVWEVSEGHEELDTFVMVICDRLGLSYEDDEVANEVANIALDRVEEGPAEEEEEDDDEDGLF